MRGEKKALRRRGSSIRGYVGENGGGKTLALVTDLLPSLEVGRPVLSNVRILDFQNPRPCDDASCQDVNHAVHFAAHPLFVPLVDFRQMLDWRDGEIVLDEIASVASSRESGALPFQVASQLQQLRRRDVTLSWTAPNWARADKILREVTQLVVHCKGYMPKDRKGVKRVWSDNRLFMWRAYDATLFDEFTAGKREKIKPRPFQVFYRPGSQSERAYDTLDVVTGLGWALESGMCIRCGGKRSIPRCSCSVGGAGSDHGEAVVHLATPTRPTRQDRRETASRAPRP